MGNICSYLSNKYNNLKKYKKIKTSTNYTSIYNNIFNIDNKNKKNQIITPLFDCNISNDITNNNNTYDNFYRKI